MKSFDGDGYPDKIKIEYSESDESETFDYISANKNNQSWVLKKLSKTNSIKIYFLSTKNANSPKVIFNFTGISCSGDDSERKIVLS